MKAKNIGNLIKSLALSAAMCAPLMAGIGFGDNVKAAENWVNIHRLCSKSGVHRYTTDGDCYKKAEWGSYNYEGIAYRGVTDPSQGVPVYEMLRGEANSSDPVPGSLLSTDQNEVRVLNSKYRNGVGWFGDKVLFYAPKTSDYPVHRLFYPRAADPRTAHHYTADANEIRVLVTQGWNDEGIVFYSAGPGEAASTSSSTGSNLVSDNVGFSKEVEDAFFEELNKIRVSNGHKALTRHAQLDAAARSRNNVVMDYYDTGKSEMIAREMEALAATGSPAIGAIDARLSYNVHEGAYEAYHKYVTDTSINKGDELVQGPRIKTPDTPANIAKAMLNNYESYKNKTGHWGSLMSVSYSHVGLSVYLKNGRAYGCVMLAIPSDGSTIAGYKDKQITGIGRFYSYYDPFRANPYDNEYNYYNADTERNEFLEYQWKRAAEDGMAMDDYKIITDFRKMKGLPSNHQAIVAALGLK